MARRAQPCLEPSTNVRKAMLTHLRARVPGAWSQRVTSCDGRGFYFSEREILLHRIQVLERGDPLDCSSAELPEPWRSDHRPPVHVVVEADGTLTLGRTHS